MQMCGTVLLRARVGVAECQSPECSLVLQHRVHAHHSSCSAKSTRFHRDERLLGIAESTSASAILLALTRLLALPHISQPEHSSTCDAALFGTEFPLAGIRGIAALTMLLLPTVLLVGLLIGNGWAVPVRTRGGLQAPQSGRPSTSSGGRQGLDSSSSSADNALGPAANRAPTGLRPTGAVFKPVVPKRPRTERVEVPNHPEPPAGFQHIPHKVTKPPAINR